MTTIRDELEIRRFTTFGDVYHSFDSRDVEVALVSRGRILINLSRVVREAIEEELWTTYTTI